MDALSLVQVFGKNAFQDENVLIIQKSSLDVTSRLSNTSESLLVAILITVLANFQGIITDENNQVITDEQNRTITFDNSEAYQVIKIIDWKPFVLVRDNKQYIMHQIIIDIYDPN